MAKHGAVDLGTVVVDAIPVEEQRAVRVVEAIALVFGARRRQEGGLETGQAHRALPRIGMEIERPALRPVAGMRVAFEDGGGDPAALQQPRQHQAARPASHDRDTRWTLHGGDSILIGSYVY